MISNNLVIIYVVWSTIPEITKTLNKNKQKKELLSHKTIYMYMTHFTSEDYTKLPY